MRFHHLVSRSSLPNSCKKKDGRMYIVHICNTSHTELPNNSNKPNEWVSKRIRVECNVRAFLMPVIIMISLLRWWSAFCDFYSFLCLKHAFHIVTFYGTWYVRPPMENGTLVAHLARMKWFSGKEETFSLSRQLFYGWNSTCIRIVCACKSKAYIYVCVCLLSSRASECVIMIDSTCLFLCHIESI